MQVRTMLLAALAATTLGAAAQDRPQGFLCCNMRSDGKWISDSNYDEAGKFVIPLGTPVKVTGYGRYRVYVDLPSGSQALGNDYSRSIEMGAFAKRYVVPENPLDKLASYPAKVQTAIKSARVTNGMTREQVLMALGYPIAGETPHLDLRTWKYWLWTFSPFRVRFDEQDRVAEVMAEDRDTLDRVYLP
jgi:hypothetical protein